MRILIIQPWIKAGGGELLSIELAAGLEAAGDEASIATLFVDPRGLPASTPHRRFVLPPAWLAGCFARSRSLTFLLGPIVLLVLILRAARRHDVLNPHNLPGPLVAAIAGPLLRRPVVWTCNEVPEALTPAAAAELGPLEALVWRAGAALSRLAARVPREILVLSEKTRAAVRASYGRDSTVIRPGVDRRTFRGEHVGTRSPFALLFVGKLHPQKDPLLAIEVLATVRDRSLDAALTIVGDGALREAVGGAIRSHGLDAHVTVERGLDGPALVERYRRADALLVTAGGHQSWGLTPFEALAAGTPAVISDELGAAEVLAPAGAAVIVHRDVDAFANALIALARDPARADRIVARGQEVLASLSWPAYVSACRAAFARATLES